MRAYSVQSMADMLDSKESTILELIHRGELVAWRLGRQWRVNHDVLEAYIEKQTWHAPTPSANR